MCLFYYGETLLSGAFKKFLDIMSKIFFGRLDVNSLGSFSGFKMRTICATFHCAGKYPLSKTTLNNWVRYFIPIARNSLRI
jgi:hypothetical protein